VTASPEKSLPFGRLLLHHRLPYSRLMPFRASWQRLRAQTSERRAEASSVRRVQLAAVARGERCPLCYRGRNDAAIESGWVVCGHDFHVRARADI
jgi:hypothetical protein